MALRLTPREQRGAALAIAAVSLAAIYGLCIHWWFTAPLQSISEEMASLRTSQQRYQALQLKRPALEAQLEALKSAPESNERLLSETDVGAATAQLMQLMSAALQRVNAGNRCNLTNRMPVAANESGPYKQVKVSINLDCRIEPLTALLYNLEHEKVSMFVESLSIRKASQLAQNENHRLNAQLLVSAYMRNGVPPEVAP